MNQQCLVAHRLHWMIFPFFSSVLSDVVFILLTPYSFHPAVLAVEQLLPLGCRLSQPGVFAAGELLKWQKIQDLPQVSAICGTSHNNTASSPARDSQGYPALVAWSSSILVSCHSIFFTIFAKQRTPLLLVQGVIESAHSNTGLRKGGSLCKLKCGSWEPATEWRHSSWWSLELLQIWTSSQTKACPPSRRFRLLFVRLFFH